MTYREKGRWRSKRKLQPGATDPGLPPPWQTEGVSQATWYRWLKQARDAAAANNEEISKPAELIQVMGHQPLTLVARRAITILWLNAHRQGIQAESHYAIETEALNMQNGDVLAETVDALMRTTLTVKLAGGENRDVQFLSGHDMTDPDRTAGVLIYRLDRLLTAILGESKTRAEISLPILMAFGSRYAVSLYENLALLVGPGKKRGHTYSLKEFRDMMGVSPDHYETFGDLNKHVIKPAIEEINAFAPFTIECIPASQHRRTPTEKIRINWRKKDAAALRDALEERHRSRTGRRERISDSGPTRGAAVSRADNNDK